MYSRRTSAIINNNKIKYARGKHNYTLYVLLILTRRVMHNNKMCNNTKRSKNKTGFN